MGAYLSTPITEKESTTGSGGPAKEWGASAMQGWRRSMEDAHVTRTDLPGGSCLFAVFDGHGGTEVSKFCGHHITEQITKHPMYGEGNWGEALIDSFHKMDSMLREPQYLSEVKRLRNKEDQQEEEEEEEEPAQGEDGARADLFHKLLSLKKMMDGGEGKEDPQVCQLPEHQIQAGCTAVVCLLSDTEVTVANAGDSRAVLCRNGVAVPLSYDHKPNQERERNRIVAAGGFVTDMNGQHRVNGNLNLSRAIGDLKYKSVPTLDPAAQIITAEPDIMTEKRSPDDEFLILACDGIWDCMTNQSACDFVRAQLASNLSTTQVAENVLDECLSKDPKESGGIGCDNMTCIIVRLK